MTEEPLSAQDQRLLIVNGDDFGRTPGINAGVARAHEHGILTSASLMVRWPAATAAAAYCRDRRTLSLGLHLDLGEWVFREGQWTCLYQVVDIQDRRAVHTEVSAQLEAFGDLVGRSPSHLDSHQHVHLSEPVRSVVVQEASRLEVPARGCGLDVRYRGDFYGQTGKGEPWPEGITVAALVRLIAELDPGITEIGCHPGEDDDFDSVYRVERTFEVETLCHADVRRALVQANVGLASFHTAKPRSNGTRTPDAIVDVATPQRAVVPADGVVIEERRASIPP